MRIIEITEDVQPPTGAPLVDIEISEGFHVDPQTIDVKITFDPETVSVGEFNDMISKVREWENKGVMSWTVNDIEVKNAQSAIKLMKKQIQPRIDAYQKKREEWKKYQWNAPDAPYAKSAELVPVRWLEKLRGNALRTDRGIKANIGYNPEIDDWDRGSLEDLAQSMKERGVQEPVTIVVGYEDGHAYIGEGNHRIAAAKIAGIKELPARVIWYRRADKSGRESGQFSYDISNDLMVEPGERLYTSKPSQVFRSLS